MSVIMRVLLIESCERCPLTYKTGAKTYECSHPDTIGFSILVDMNSTPVGLMDYCPLPKSTLVVGGNLDNLIMPLVNTILETDDDNSTKAVRLVAELKQLLQNAAKM